MPLVKIPATPNPGINDPYPSTETRRGRAMIFQVTDPANQPIWSYQLALHVNPKSFDEKFTKNKSVAQTYGGYVEWIWPDELDTISATASTGAFLGPDTGLVSGSSGAGALINGQSSRAGVVGRHGTIAWERQEDLLDLFRNNGVIFNGQGFPVLRGNVMCIYDRGIYIGYFTSFEPHEDDEHAFSFELNWEFKIIASVYKFPGAANASGAAGFTFLNKTAAQQQSAASQAQVAVQNQATTSNNGPDVPPAANFASFGTPGATG